ncbi:hypothetical protein MSAN_01908100 [Mycena sanguinolenta]|uniref:DUF6533 domain-containing protein n=1 Tax=Mycena sanguinolenta TaxID=230812 RepID=A0A8H7CRZ8_9AGAR|nr:hypothetical protein MSAN_01908100 [Mycena sanguinolenta]
MSDYPLPTWQDSTELDYATFARDQTHPAILIYDYLLTFGAEVKYIWSSKLRPGTCLLLAIRYLGLGANITICAYNFIYFTHEVRRRIAAPPASFNLLVASSKNCVKMQWVWMMFIVFLELLVEVTLALRVYAMYGLNKWILACLLSTNVAAGVVALFAIIEYGKNPDLLAAPGFSGCDAAYPTRSVAARPAGGWEATLVCDILVFGLTARRAFIQRKISPLYSGSLIERMATDGTMYFGIIVLACLANALTFYLGDAMLSGFLSWLTTNLSLTLLSRLMLNLHEAADLRTTLNTRDLESLRFATVPMTLDEEL